MNASPSAETKVVTIFRSRLNEEHREEYAALAPEITALAKTMPGFLSAKTFTAKDGERVTIVEFDTMENHENWNCHPRHREVKRLGIEKFYSQYDIQVCSVSKERHFVRKPPLG